MKLQEKKRFVKGEQLLLHSTGYMYLFGVCVWDCPWQWIWLYYNFLVYIDDIISIISPQKTQCYVVFRFFGDWV